MKLSSNNFLLEAEMNIKIAEMGMKYEEVHIPYRERGTGIQKSRVLKSNSVRAITWYTITHVLRKLKGIRILDN